MMLFNQIIILFSNFILIAMFETSFICIDSQTFIIGSKSRGTVSDQVTEILLF